MRERTANQAKRKKWHIIEIVLRMNEIDINPTLDKISSPESCFFEISWKDNKIVYPSKTNQEMK